MNRPNQWEEKYDHNGMLMVNEYLNDLEKYCDELEKINERMVWHVKKCNEQSEKIRQLEKALDFLSQHSSYCPGFGKCDGKSCKDCVKEYVMKEVQNE